MLRIMSFNPSDLTTLLRERTAPAVRLAMLFGSRAGDNARADSDIDLAVLAEGPLTAEDKLSLIGDIGARFGLPVDLIDLHDMPYPVSGEALAGRRLIGDATTHGALLSRALTDREDFGPLQRRIIDGRLDRWLRT